MKPTFKMRHLILLLAIITWAIAYETIPTRFGVSLSLASQHHPEGPNFQRLLLHLKSILPEKERKDENFVQSVVDMLKSVDISDEEKRNVVKQIELLAELCLRDIRQRGRAQKKHMDELIQLFNKLFQNHQHEKKELGAGLAPFCAAGDDCFADVRPESIVHEIEAAAEAVSAYLRRRMSVEAQRNELKTKKSSCCDALTSYHIDAILTHLVSLVSQLHRSTLRNWHHILLVLNNLADNNGDGDLADLVQVQCDVVVEPEHHLLEASVSECSRKDDWALEGRCKSPITNPEKQCQPKEHHGNMRKIGNQYAFQVEHPGRWHVSVHITLEEEKNDRDLHETRIIGAVDRVISAQHQKLKELILIDQHVRFHDGKKAHAEASGEGEFEVHDSILVRMAPSKFRVRLVFKAHLIESKNNKRSFNNNKDRKGGHKEIAKNDVVNNKMSNNEMGRDEIFNSEEQLGGIEESREKDKESEDLLKGIESGKEEITLKDESKKRESKRTSSENHSKELKLDVNEKHNTEGNNEKEDEEDDEEDEENVEDSEEEEGEEKNDKEDDERDDEQADFMSEDETEESDEKTTEEDFLLETSSEINDETDSKLTENNKSKDIDSLGKNTKNLEKKKELLEDLNKDVKEELEKTIKEEGSSEIDIPGAGNMLDIDESDENYE